MDASRRFVLVTRRSRLDDLVARHNTVGQARFQVEHLGGDFDDIEDEHRVNQVAIRQVEAALARHGRVQRIDRSLLPTFLFPPEAGVVVVGQDGLVANTLKYLGEQAVLAVNPDPARFDGPLLPFTTQQVDQVIAAWCAGELGEQRITLAQVCLADGQQLLAVNDLFIGPRSHTSARYRIEVGDRAETQSSSGVIVSTGLGSTGWLRSLLVGAMGIAGAGQAERRQVAESGFGWEEARLCFTVREPFPSRTSRATLVHGWVDDSRPLTLVSQMAGTGVIFSDGIEADCIEFNAGMRAEVGIAPRQRRLIIGGRSA